MIKTEFVEFGLHENIIKAIREINFITPTPIQKQVIPFLLNSQQDLVALAQTGTGKTAAFGLPILQQLSSQSNKSIQCIILSPTRELCVQISKDLLNYSKYLQQINIVSVYGGASVENQIKEIRRGADIVVGTPGRVLDLVKRKILKLQDIKWLVLDEADEMLNMGFKEDLDQILETTSKQRQTLLFSATMPDEILRIANLYMKQPHEISVGKKNAGVENIEHFYYVVAAKDRYLALKRIVDINPDIYGIVFCRTRKETQEVAQKLIEDGYDADALHGDLSQAQRDHVMQKFRNAHLQLLVATDVAARGLDVNNLSHIINYNLPDENEVYIHRSGRTGRAGKKGECISIVHSKELHKIREIEKQLKLPIKQKPVPSGKEVCKVQLLSIIDKIKKTKTIDNQIEDFLGLIFDRLDGLDREELIKRFVSVEFNRFLTYYKNAPDLNVKLREENKPDRFNKETKKRNSKGIEFTKFFLTLGEKDGLSKKKLMELINANDNLAGVEIGKIEILPGYTFFEIDSNYTDAVIKAFHNKRYSGKRLKIEIKNQKQGILNKK
ncbi:MAG: DEAD/DEAH box helicase [Bacteroidales bacterium]